MELEIVQQVKRPLNIIQEQNNGITHIKKRENPEITYFNAKLINGVLTEIVNSADNFGNFKSEYYYEKITTHTYSYRESRTYQNGTNVMTWYFDANKLN